MMASPSLEFPINFCSCCSCEEMVYSPLKDDQYERSGPPIESLQRITGTRSEEFVRPSKE